MINNIVQGFEPLSAEVLVEHSQLQAANPAAILTVGAFHGTPWERPLQRASERQPAITQDVYRGIVGLYWAYGGDLPTTRGLQEPTRQLLTQLTRQHQQWPRSVELSSSQDRKQVLSVAAQLNGFVGMWAAMHANEPGTLRTPQTLASTLHADAATRLDTITYECPGYEQTLDQLTQDFGGQVGQENQQVYNSLSRHFSDSETAPPIAVVNSDLRQTLAMLRDRYISILKSTDHNADPDGERLLWELVGTDKRATPLSLREALLSVDDPNERVKLRTALLKELAALHDPALLEQAAKRKRTSMRLGALAADDTGELPYTEPVEIVDLWELVDRMKAGGQDGTDAFATLYDQTKYTVYRLIRSRVYSTEVAEDITSQLYIRALQGLPKVEQQGKKVTAWLYAVANNLVYDYLKSATYRNEVFSEMPIDNARPETTGHTPDSAWLGPENPILYSEMKAILTKGIAQLASPAQRECVKLRYLEGLSTKETADKLKISEKAAKSLLFRALESLEKELEDQYSFRI